MIGECGCNETMVEQVVVGLADVLPAGDKGETGSDIRLINLTVIMI